RGALKAPDTSICHWPKITISRQTQDALHLSNGWAAITFLERRSRNRWCWRPRPPASFCHPPPSCPEAYRVCTGPSRTKKNGKQAFQVKRECLKSESEGAKNKVFVLCGIVGKRAFIAPVISVVGA